MTEQPESKPQAEAALEALVGAERELNARLAAARDEAEAQVQRASAAAQDRLVQERRRIAHEGAQLLEQRRQQVDDELTRETRDTERELARLAETLGALRTQLRERILAEVLGP